MFDLPTEMIIAIAIITSTKTIIPAIIPDGVPGPLEVGVSDDKLKDVIL